MKSGIFSLKYRTFNAKLYLAFAVITLLTLSLTGFLLYSFQKFNTLARTLLTISGRCFIVNRLIVLVGSKAPK